jgi:hypothetical protein
VAIILLLSGSNCIKGYSQVLLVMEIMNCYDVFHLMLLYRNLIKFNVSKKNNYKCCEHASLNSSHSNDKSNQYLGNFHFVEYLNLVVCGDNAMQ